MPGMSFLADASYAASMGYAQPVDQRGAYGQPSHTSFVVWLIVFALASIAILGGLRVGGFTFVFRTR